MISLLEVLVFLGAAAVLVPLSKRLGLGAVLGYLAAGIVIGPWVKSRIDLEGVLSFAEIGVVFLLFIIGLELHPARLWVLRKAVFGFGTLQVLVTGILLFLIVRALGIDTRSALVIGFGLALSSTAFVLQMLAEKKELARPHGRAAFGILLFQDLAVIPLIAVVSLLAGAELTETGQQAGWLGFLRALVVLTVFIVGGHYLLRPLLRTVAAAQIQEIFTAAALLLVIGAAVLMQWLGLSMGLGAFLAGVLVADSEYRHQLETDIQPFKGLLLGLFFIAVGMSTNLSLLAAEPVSIVTLTVGLMIVKALVLFGLALTFGLSGRHAVALSLILAQGGEFAFVLFTIAVGQELLSAQIAERLTLIVTLSMAGTPLIYLVHTWVVGRLRLDRDSRPFDVVEDTDHEVVIAGFGRFGQIVARILNMRQIPFTALEINPRQVDFVKRYGNKIYYGDASRLDLLRAAHVEKAKLLVLAVDDVETSVKIAESVCRHFPDVAVYARARDRQHALKLMSLGAKGVIRDTLLSSVALTSEVLTGLGLSESEAAHAAEVFRQHDTELLQQQYAIRDDEEALIQSSKEMAQQLRELFESDASG